MLHVIVLLQIRHPDAFDDFEARAIDILREHGGKLDVAFRPDPELSSVPDIGEVHYLTFPDIDAFRRYRADARLQALGELRSAAIAATTVLVSGQTRQYAAHESVTTDEP